MRRAHREELPRFIPPMLATSGSAPTDASWAMEVKWDGIRAQLRFDGRTVCVRSRPGRDCTDEFPELTEIAGALRGASVILDGELVCPGAEGKPDFAALRARFGARGARRVAQPRRPVTLMVFDVLHLDGDAARDLPYARRRELLAGLQLDGRAWGVPRHFIGAGSALLVATAEQGLEGVVAKRLDAGYTEGRRSRAWVKHKHRRRERLVVTGWREREGALPQFLVARRGPGGRAAAGRQREPRVARSAPCRAPRGTGCAGGLAEGAAVAGAMGESRC